MEEKIFKFFVEKLLVYEFRPPYKKADFFIVLWGLCVSW